jgi:hypothetical protein
MSQSARAAVRTGPTGSKVMSNKMNVTLSIYQFTDAVRVRSSRLIGRQREIQTHT